MSESTRTIRSVLARHKVSAEPTRTHLWCGRVRRLDVLIFTCAWGTERRMAFLNTTMETSLETPVWEPQCGQKP
jgi:hypothetical protein